MNRKHVVGALSSLWLLAGCGAGMEPNGQWDPSSETPAPAQAGGTQKSKFDRAKTPSESALTNQDIFTELKQAESQLPVPPASATSEVGSFNCTTGVFGGNVSEVEIINGKPVRLQASATVGAKAVDLVYRSYSCPSGFHVTVAGVTHSTTTANGTITVRVNGSAAGKLVSWRTYQGTKSYTDSLQVTFRPPQGVGAFKVNAMPVGIVYEPPPNAAHTNKQTFTTLSQQTIVTDVSTTSSTDSSVKTGWMGLGQLGDAVHALAQLNTAAKTTLQVADALFGHADTSNLSGTSVNTDSSLGITSAAQQSFTTSANLGPGKGDLFIFYKGASVAWYWNGWKAQLTVLDQGTLGVATAADMQADLASLAAGGIAAQTGLDAQTLTDLLALDPFVASAAPVLDATRFSDQTEFQLGSNVIFANLISQTITSTDKQTNTSYTGTLTQTHQGWLGLIGIGYSSDGTTTTKITYSNSTTETNTSTVSSQFSVSTNATETDDFNQAFDGPFNSIALWRKPVVRCPFCVPVTDGGIVVGR